jgi:hypothetical protein
MLKRWYHIDVTTHDSKGATALHFAAMSLLIKNVQALIKLGADPNCVDQDGNTPMHLCMMTLFEDNPNYEKVKNLVKELIFSGADRSKKNSEGQTAMDILEQLKPDLSEFDYDKLKYILTPPKGTKFLRMTRPIEKVTRNKDCQVGALLFNLFVIALFGFAGIEDWLNNKKNES